MLFLRRGRHGGAQLVGNLRDGVARIDEEQHAERIAAERDVRDLRNLLWSSIDNDTSRDLDQIEVAERMASGIRIRVGVADVDGDVQIGSAFSSDSQCSMRSLRSAFRT